MAGLKKVTMVNIQSHAHTELEFPETGVVRLYGDNSNGKSVMVKCLWDVVNSDVSKPRFRRSLIRRGCDFGEVTYERHDGLTLFVHIHVDAAQTYAEIYNQGEQPVRRYLSEKTIPLLVAKFGFHYNDTHAISVNVHRDDDPFLFASTKHTVNYDLMDTAMSDKFAEKSLEELERVMSEAKKYKKQFEQAKEVVEASLESIQLYDIETETKQKEKMSWILNNLNKCNNFDFEIPKLSPMPKVAFIKVFNALPDVIYPKIYKCTEDKQPGIDEIYQELVQLRSNVCPLCKRGF
jgi:hypothetical protein